MPAIHAGTFDFAAAAFGFGGGERANLVKTIVVVGITLSQGLLNHYGIRLTTRLTDLSRWLILLVSGALTASLLAVVSWSLFAGIVIAQYFCVLAALTSASRMAYAFARNRSAFADHLRPICFRNRPLLNPPHLGKPQPPSLHFS